MSGPRRRRTPGWGDGATRRPIIVTAIVVGVSALATYFAFAKQVPFQSHHEIRATFAGINQLERGDDVRVSGLRVGRVQKVQAGPGATSVVTVRITDDAIHLHRDATMSIRPRLALEGNDYVDVRPGSPTSPALRSDETIPVSQTDRAVQLDELLSALTRPTRDAFKNTVEGFAQGLGPAPPAAASPQSGAQGLRGAVRELDGALGSVTAVTRAAQGTRAGDLRRAVASTGEMSAQFAEDPAALAGLVTHFNRSMGALADQDAALAASVRGFDDLVKQAPPSLTAIDRALPRVTRFAGVLRPALRAAPGPLTSFDRLLAQLGGLSGPRELPRLVRTLAPITRDLPGLQQQLRLLFPDVTLLGRCVAEKVVPVLNTVVADGPNTSGRPIWQDLLHLGANLAGAASDFDGNGTTIRLGITESEQALSGVVPGLGKLAGIGPAAEGVRPMWLGYGVNPPFRPDARCIDQPLVDMTKRSGGPAKTIRAVPKKPLTRAHRSLLSALTGTAADRRGLLKTLLSRLARADADKKRAKAPADRKPPLRLPVLKSPGNAGAAKPQRPAAAKPAPTLDRVVPSLVDTVKDVLGAVLGKPR
jgi:virulence factor Mce-like protein